MIVLRDEIGLSIATRLNLSTEGHISTTAVETLAGWGPHANLERGSAMAPREQSTRNQLALSIGLALVGIASAIYGIDSLGGIVALGGLAFLGLSIHRLGRVGVDL